MHGTYSQIYLHIILGVQGRLNLIPNEHKEELYKYITGIITNKHHKLISINCMPDHVHVFVGFEPAESVSALVKEIKRCATNFIDEKGWVMGRFSWQEGFGAFSYSHSQINNVCRYIENQEEHHGIRTFREEYEEFLRAFKVEYNTKYIFEGEEEFEDKE